MLLFHSVCVCVCVGVVVSVPYSVSPGNAGVAAGPPAAAEPEGTGAMVHSECEPKVYGEAAC